MARAKAFETSVIVSLFLLIFLATLPIETVAQTPAAGNNAVYNSSGTCCSGSGAWIDASAFANTSTDICATIYGVLSPSTYPAAGAVIDARGLNSVNSNLTCASGTTPWFNGSTYEDKPSVLLLPGGAINIAYTWVLPNKTKVVGLGASSAGQTGTTLVASSGFTGPQVPNIPLAMIQFGDVNRTQAVTCLSSTGMPTGVCFGIAIEDLTLNGGGSINPHLDGIVNFDSQELTYVTRVNLYQIIATGLQIENSMFSNQGGNSGPYSDITFSPGPSATSSTVCAQMYSQATRGIHGLNCTANGTPAAAIYLDAVTTTLEDIHIDGFQDGIVVGANNLAQSDVILNVSGSSAVNNLIHICGSTSSGNCPGGATNVADLTISGATSGGGNTVKDDLTGATLPNATDAHVGMYIVGEATAGGYSRFSTSKTYPTWFVGHFQIPGLATSCTATSNGSLYSTSSSGNSLWACVNGNWALVK